MVFKTSREISDLISKMFCMCEYLTLESYLEFYWYLCRLQKCRVHVYALFWDFILNWTKQAAGQQWVLLNFWLFVKFEKSLTNTTKRSHELCSSLYSSPPTSYQIRDFHCSCWTFAGWASNKLAESILGGRGAPGRSSNARCWRFLANFAI